MPENPIRFEGTFPEQTPARPEPTAPYVPSSETAIGAGPKADGRQPTVDSRDLMAGRYALGEEIARGGMGVVRRGVDTVFEREVAVKLLLADPPRHSHLVQRFVDEAHITGQLQHPGIPPVHDLGTLSDGRPYLVMKLIRGRTLADWLRERSSHGEGLPRWMQVFEQLAQAVGFAHAQGIIHRDLKPLNVMVGAFGEVQVMDWGLAKKLDTETRRHGDTETRRPQRAGIPLLVPLSPCLEPSAAPDEQRDLTREGQILGTPGYMAPEQARGEAVNARADVFALGSILTAILTGQPAFVGATASETIAKAASADLLDALARLAACGADAELVALATCCLAAKAEDRPADARAVADQVAAHRAGVEARLRQAETERAAALVREAEHHKRRRVWLGLAATLLVGVIASSALALWANQARADAETARHAEADRAEGERQAKETAEKRLAQTEKGIDLLGSVFTDLDPRAEEKEGLPLRVLLGDRLTQAAEQLEGEAVGHPLLVAGLQDRLGLSLLNLGMADRAIPLLARARATRAASLGTDHPATLSSMNNLAEGYRAAGKLEQALPLYEETLKLQKAKLGADHPDTLVSMNNLAEGYRATGKLDQALPLYEETLKLMKAELGTDHPNTLSSMNNLAEGYRVAGQLDQALALYEETLKLRKAKLGADHADTLASMNNLALCYRAAGQLDQALPLLEETLKLIKAKLGADHPHTLASMNNLALGYQAAGKLDQALPLLEETFKLVKARLGADHPHTLASMNNLAAGYRDAGKLDRALPLFQEAAAGIEKRWFQHEHAGRLVNNLINCHEQLKQFEQAEPWRRKWLAVVKERAGADSLPYAGELAGLGSNQLQQKKWTDAEAVLRECLALREKKAPDEWTTFNTKSMLGGALLGHKKYAEAEPLLVQGYEGMKQREAKIPPQAKDLRLREALERLVQLYDAWGKSDEAARWRKELEAVKAAEKK